LQKKDSECFDGFSVNGKRSSISNSSIGAGLCHDTYSAHQGMEHDDMNVLVLGARVAFISVRTSLVA
jgi:ribose 5-phosphate isomerase RpiB